MTIGAPAGCSADGGCITCGDEAVPMRVVRLEGAEAVCADAGARLHSVAVELVPEAGIGHTLLVHAGVAIRSLGVAA